MKKIIFLVISAVIVAGCSQPVAHHTPPVAPVAKNCKYVCIMDKNICADKPGICPKCGMQLVEKADK